MIWEVWGVFGFQDGRLVGRMVGKYVGIIVFLLRGEVEPHGLCA